MDVGGIKRNPAVVVEMTGNQSHLGILLLIHGLDARRELAVRFAASGRLGINLEETTERCCLDRTYYSGIGRQARIVS